MNIEELEKLNELKEKGVITQEEFDKKKEEMLSGGNKAQKQTSIINWYNLGISFLFGLGSLGILIIIPLMLYAIDRNVPEATIENLRYLINFIVAIIMSIIAYKLETKKYKNVAPIWATLLGVFLFGPLGVWLVSYDFLQIKDGLKELKVKKNK